MYVLRCADGTLYTGITTDLERRLREHNGVAGTGRRGAAYTRARRPVRLVHREPAPDRALATRRERAITALDRRAKEALLGADAGATTPRRGVGTGCKERLGRPSSTA